MGSKIKTFAKCFMILGIVICLVSAAYVLVSCYNRNLGFYHLQHATINGGNPHSDWVGSDWEAKGNDIYNSIMIAAYLGSGAIGFLFFGLPLYWFGCLFQRVEYMQTDIDDLLNRIQGGKPNA